MELLLKEYEDGPPPGTALLAQGTDRVRLSLEMTWRGGDGKPLSEMVPVETDWDSILDSIARILLTDPLEDAIRSALANMLKVNCDRVWESGEHPLTISLADNSCELIRLQFRALGIAIQMLEDVKITLGGTSISRARDYRWVLTPYGDRCLAQRLAIRRSHSE